MGAWTCVVVEVREVRVARVGAWSEGTFPMVSVVLSSLIDWFN